LTVYQTVQRAKTELESTVDAVEQLICVLGKDGHILRLNKMIERWSLGQAGLDKASFGPDGLAKVKETKGKHLHAVMHPACTNDKCYLKQLIGLSNKVITTGESAEYSGFDSELNRKLLVQMIPAGANEALGTHKLDAANQLVMIFFDITHLDFFNPSLESLNRWHPIDTTPKVVTLHSKKADYLAQHSNQTLEVNVKNIKFKDIEKIKLEWAAAIDVLPQLICLLSVDGKIERANRAVELWGLGEVTQIKGRHLHDMLHPGCDDEQCYLLGFNQLIAEVIATGKSAECQVLDAPLNRHLHFQMSVVPFKSQLSSHFVVILVCDVTDVKHAELKIEHLNTKLEKRIEARARHLQKINQQLQAEIEQRKLIEMELTISRQKFSHLVELMNEGMVIQDLNKKVTYANKHLLKMLGLPRTEVVGHLFTDFVDADYLDAWATGTLTNVKTAESSYVFKMHGRGNKGLWVKGAPQLLFDADKNCIGSYAVITDINDQIEIEQKLLRTESKLRSLAKQVLNAQEQERKRIASELHDGIGQTLSAIKFYVENSISNLSEATTSSAIAEFEKVVPKLQGAVEEVRRISMALRPSLLDDIGILATLHWFCRESNIGTPKINFSYHNNNVVEEDISPVLKTEIFRVVQEAVNNATKYSKANNIHVITKEKDKHLHLEIVDDGIGFDYAVTASKQGYAESKGMGLVSMRERVENSGGYFSVNSTPSKGTAIICLWSKGRDSFIDNRSGRSDRRKNDYNQ
jgi:PAS domain S-box-containing protein